MRQVQESEELTLVSGGTILVVPRKQAADLVAGEAIQSSRGQTWQVREARPTGRLVGLLTIPI